MLVNTNLSEGLACCALLLALVGLAVTATISRDNTGEAHEKKGDRGMSKKYRVVSKNREGEKVYYWDYQNWCSSKATAHVFDGDVVTGSLRGLLDAGVAWREEVSPNVASGGWGR